MCFIQWAMMPLGYLRSNMQSKPDNIRLLQLIRTLNVTASSWIALVLHTTGVENFARAMLTIINGRSGFSCNCLPHGIMLIRIKLSLSVNWFQCLRQTEQEVLRQLVMRKFIHLLLLNGKHLQKSNSRKNY
ncbi:hypothetical protein D3C80_1150350 [compost metagenome]